MLRLYSFLRFAKVLQKGVKESHFRRRERGTDLREFNGKGNYHQKAPRNVEQQTQNLRDQKRKQENVPEGVKHILAKKSLAAIDLAFLYNQIAADAVKLTITLSERLYSELKGISEYDITLTDKLVELSAMVGYTSPPDKLKQYFLSCHGRSAIDSRIIKALPPLFLKRVGSALLSISMKRNNLEFIELFRNIGSLLSIKDLKNFDNQCTTIPLSMEETVKLLAIFRQIKKTGLFVEAALDGVIKQAADLSDKLLISAMLSLIQLGKNQRFAELEKEILRRAENKILEQQATIIAIQIFHAHKIGSKESWVAFRKQNDTLADEVIFPLLSGFYRSSYTYDVQLFLRFISIDVQMKYLETISNQNFIELFLVLFNNLRQFEEGHQKRQLKRIFAQNYQKRRLTSVHREVQCFFIYLLTGEKDLLMKSYPNDLQLSLLGIILDNLGPVNQKETNEYISELQSRTSPEYFNEHKFEIVMEQFVRLKLLAVEQRRKIEE